MKGDTVWVQRVYESREHHKVRIKMWQRMDRAAICHIFSELDADGNGKVLVSSLCLTSNLGSLSVLSVSTFSSSCHFCLQSSLLPARSANLPLVCSLVHLTSLVRIVCLLCLSSCKMSSASCSSELHPCRWSVTELRRSSAENSTLPICGSCNLCDYLLIQLPSHSIATEACGPAGGILAILHNSHLASLSLSPQRK